MNHKIILTGAACMLFAASCSETDSTTTTTGDTMTSNGGLPVGDGSASGSGAVALSETDSYVDLKTGKTIRIRRDATTNQYTAEDMTPLDIYVNTTSRDTFWGPTGTRVNGALMRGDDGMYTVDELRIERNGDGYKAKSEDGDFKIKENSEELKIKDGDVKIKSTDDEYKYKDGHTKIKSNEDETKIKTPDSKTEIDHETGEVKTKAR